jgi:cholesterol transport system auxiliary component
MKALCVPLILFTTISLTACAFGPVASREVNTYTLSTQKTAKRCSQIKADTLLVAMPQAMPGYQTEKMAYRQQTNEIAYYTRNTWIAPPAELLQPMIIRTLQNSGCVGSVVPEPYLGVADLRLDTQVLQFARVYANKQDKRGAYHIAVNTQLVDTISNRVVASQNTQVQQPIKSSQPRAGVEAANLAANTVMQDIAKLCQKHC